MDSTVHKRHRQLQSTFKGAGARLPVRIPAVHCCGTDSVLVASEGAAPQQSTRAGGSGTSFLGIESLLGLKPLAAVYGTPLSKGSRRLGPRKSSTPVLPVPLSCFHEHSSWKGRIMGRLKTVMLETPDAFASGVPNPMANVQEDTARPSMPK
eukprot:1345561-Rhodomonas_salina.1